MTFKRAQSSIFPLTPNGTFASPTLADNQVKLILVFSGFGHWALHELFHSTKCVINTLSEQFLSRAIRDPGRYLPLMFGKKVDECSDQSLLNASIFFLTSRYLV